MCVWTSEIIHSFETFFILSRTFFLSLAPFQELNNTNRAKSLPSHLVSAVRCLLQGVGSGHSRGVNSKDWSSLSLLHFQAQITWDVFRPAWLLAGFLPEPGNGNQENKCFNFFFFVCVWIWERYDKERFWAIRHTLVMCIQGSSSPLIQTDLFYSCIWKILF